MSCSVAVLSCVADDEAGLAGSSDWLVLTVLLAALISSHAMLCLAWYRNPACGNASARSWALLGACAVPCVCDASRELRARDATLESVEDTLLERATKSIERRADPTEHVVEVGVARSRVLARLEVDARRDDLCATPCARCAAG